MGVPTLPPTLTPDREYSLEVLLSEVELGAEIDDTHSRAYPVLVTYAACSATWRIPTHANQTNRTAHTASRCATAERVRLERTRASIA